MSELPIIQKTYDLIKWYVPILNRLPRDHRFTLGDRTSIFMILKKEVVTEWRKWISIGNMCANS